MSLTPLGGLPKPHARARGAHPDLVARVEVPDDKVAWAVEWQVRSPPHLPCISPYAHLLSSSLAGRGALAGPEAL